MLDGMDEEQSGLLEQVRKARARLEEQQDGVHEARRAYIDSVRRLYESGMPLREIADELGLSHQRVHQMVTESSGRGANVGRKIAKGAAGLALMMRTALLVMQLTQADGAHVRQQPQRAHDNEAQDAPNRLFIVRGSIAKRYPELKALLKALRSYEVIKVTVTEASRLRIEFDSRCFYFADWMQPDDHQWMLTRPPTPCVGSQA